MAKEVIMPALGLAQETGILLQWFKSEGDEITQGEPLMEIETDKATVEVEAPASGILANVTAAAGDEIPVGQVIALILAPGESLSELPAAPATPASTSAEPTPAKPAVSFDGQTTPEITASPVAARMAAEHNLDLKAIKPQGGRIQKSDVLAYLEAQKTAAPSAALPRLLPASPKARRLAAEHNLDLTTLTGSGPEGAVLAADVLAAAAAPAMAPIPAPTPEAISVSAIWRIMAERTTQSWTHVPHFFLVREVNASRLLTWHEKAQKRSVEKLTYTDLLVKLIAAALAEHPHLNASWDEGTIRLNNQINIGLAVAIEAGLTVPVIHQANTLNLSQLAARRKDLVGRAQAGKLRPADLSDGTFTLSNLGMYGVDAFNAIINPPQAAILAVGRIVERVVPVNNQPAVQPMMTLTLSCDHRVVDGARAARFLNTLAELIEEPLGLL